MHEAFWNGLFDVRWEEAPLGPEAIRLIQRLRERGYAGRTRLEDGTPVEQIADILGHQSVTSTGVYLKSSLGLLASCALDLAVAL